MENFFSKLNPLAAFLQFTNNVYYTQAPDDWLVVITDVEGSTRAIEAGKYKWVKGGRGLILDGDEEESGKALEGLSCRWAPLKSARGLMLSIIAQPRAEGKNAETILLSVAKEIDRIVDLESPDTHPVKDESLEPEKLLKASIAEAGLQGAKPRWLGILKVMTEMLIVKVLDRFNIRLPHIHFRKYKSTMVAHSDYRKYDEQLRMVIDCSPKMRDEIRTHLTRMKNSGALYFGTHESDSALMTCFLESYDEGGHIHFVDGNDGGYALAAKELKSQKSKA